MLRNSQTFSRVPLSHRQRWIQLAFQSCRLRSRCFWKNVDAVLCNIGCGLSIRDQKKVNGRESFHERGGVGTKQCVCVYIYIYIYIFSNVYFKLYWIIGAAEGRENEWFSMEDDNFRF